MHFSPKNSKNFYSELHAYNILKMTLYYQVKIAEIDF